MLAKIRFFSLLCAFLMGFLSLEISAEVDTKKNKEEIYKALNLFGAVLERVYQEYVDDIPIPELVKKSLDGMLRNLDPNSSYLSQKDMRDLKEQTQGEYGGIGVEMSIDDYVPSIIAPYEQTPAAKAGIKPGDIITHINKKQTQGLTLDQVTDLIKGKPGEKITLTLIRKGGKSFDITVEREIIKIPSVRSSRYNDIGYIRIITFMNTQTAEDLKKEFDKMNTQKPLKGLVLDMRDNPGGLFDEAIKVAELFLDNKEIVSFKGRKAKDIRRYYAKSGDITKGLPLSVLVNGGTASCPEIVAAALQDHKRAVIVGENTYGKGTVQTVIPLELENQEAIRLTTARYITPSGKTLERHKGITPNIMIPSASIKVSSSTGSISQDSDNLHKDYQLKRAVELLEGLIIYDDMQKK
jgi:carboxyl-terminal processing protease